MAVIEKYGGYVSSITFNNGEKINVEENDIVIFVGPNNVGKSQCLKDIFALLKTPSNTTVVKNITVKKEETRLEDFLKKETTIIDSGNHIRYCGLSYTIDSISFQAIERSPAFESAREAFAVYLDTDARLSICKPADNINRDEQKKHPIHKVAFDSATRKRMSYFFMKAFGKEIVPNLLYGRTIPLCMGEPVILDNSIYEDDTSRIEKFGEMISKLPQVHEQGDGIKSFTGILLSLINHSYRTFLIDEPESFLHPPQARIMGHTIGELLMSHQQAFISTHSSEIIKGLMDTCPERIKLVRVTREDINNSFSVLNNLELTNLWRDPLLGYSEIVSGIFHKNVVLCESDSDCKLYSIVESHIKEKNGSFSETLYVHCGGKQRMHKIVSAIKSLNVSVKIIPDIDILNDKGVFRQLVEAGGGDWNDFDTNLSKLDSSLSTTRSHVDRKSLKNKIDSLLDSSSDRYLSAKEIKCIGEFVKIDSKWNRLKNGGIDSAPAGDGYSALIDILTKAQKLGIYIVPVGELECFIKSVGGHGPDWVNKVLEKFPDLDNDVYKRIREFVESWGL